MKTFFTMLSTATAVVVCTASFASAQGACCPHGNGACSEKVCCPKVTVKKSTKHCWQVECKEICIPAIRFPWTRCGESRCGRVRVVKVLKKVEYDVEKCETKWTIVGHGCSTAQGRCAGSVGCTQQTCR